MGGGLAGLTAAYRLHAAGISFHMMKARNRLGGRILSLDGKGLPADDGFDLGPSRFLVKVQPAFADFVRESERGIFSRPASDDLMVQRDPGPALHYAAMPRDPASMRIVGGTDELIAALAHRVPQSSLHLSTRAKKRSLRGSEAAVEVIGALAALHIMNTTHAPLRHPEILSMPS